MGRMKEELMSLEIRMLYYQELSGLVTIANIFCHITVGEAALHYAEIARDTAAELGRNFEEEACNYCRGLGWTEPR